MTPYNPAMSNSTQSSSPSAPAAPRALPLRVSAKGAVSVYGLGRFPVTLYASQWDALLANADAIAEFLKTNRLALASKS